jgi:sugar/nucleoside kinase (ribokinase family)
MIQVTSVGDVNIDILSETIDEIKNEQKIVEEIKIKVGGGAANFAFWLSKLGMKVRLIGLIGNDYFGKFIVKVLKNAGIDLKLKTVNKPTGITLGIQFKDGSKKLITFKGTNKFLSLKHIKISEIEGKIVYFSGYNLLENLRKDLPILLKKLKEKNKIISFDPDLKAGINFKIRDFLKTIKFVDIMFLNEREASLIKNSLKNFKGTVVIKRGKNGAVAIKDREKVKVCGIKTEVKNPTGAGDVFNAAFIHHYYYGYELKECLKFAIKESVKYLKIF